jgi:3-(3-hydroxy-phenyl)propionate hydroxylase
LSEVGRGRAIRFPNVSVLLEHECLGLVPWEDSVELILAGFDADQFRRIQSSYVVADDGSRASNAPHRKDPDPG